MKYQITLTASNGKYRPVSAIVESEKVNLFDVSAKNKIIAKGIKKICIKRYWKTKDLQKYGYDNAKVREYDKEKIEEQNRRRYERIKEEKYQSGEWQRPKNS